MQTSCWAMWQQVFLHSLTSSRSPASSKWHKLFHTCVWNQSTSKIYNRDVCRHTIQTVHQAKYFAKKACPLSKCYSTCSTHNEEDVRKNELGIQMLTKTLRDQIFAQTKDIRHTEGLNAKKLVEIETHLKKFDLWDKTTELLPDVDLKLPGLRGSNIDEHFRELAERQTAKYVKEADRLASCELPPMPKVQWNLLIMKLLDQLKWHFVAILNKFLIPIFLSRLINDKVVINDHSLCLSVYIRKTYSLKQVERLLE